MINKHKLHSMALVLIAMILVLVSIAGASPYAYITNYGSSNVSVIDTTTNKVTATVPVGAEPYGIAVSPDGKKVYMTSELNYDIPGTVSVINTTTNKVITNVTV